MQDTITADTEIQTILSKLSSALQNSDIDCVLGLFADTCYWRDLLAFTWNIKTLEGKGQIRDMLAQQLADVRPTDWAVSDEDLIIRSDDSTEGFIRFETKVANGYGYVRLRHGLIETLLTTIQELKGYEFGRPFGARHGDEQAEPSWAEEREDELSALGVATQPYVLIVGAGQNGLALGARLRQLEVPTLIVEKDERPGDSWRKRYKSLCLHNPVWENPFPFMEFPDNWPIFTPKDKYADWLESYAKLMELNIWGRSEAKNAHYDEASQTWSVNIERAGETITLHPKHLVFATGLSGSRPRMPDVPGRDAFKGVIQHSAEHGGPESMQGKKVVVVGAGVSAHDICSALALNDIDVTMVQRSSTYVIRSPLFLKYILGPVYSAEAVENGITADKGDMLNASVPFAQFFGFMKQAVDQVREADSAFYRDLAASGFLIDHGPGGAGLFGKYMTGANSYYLDIGASQMIIDGRIKLAAGAGVKALTANSVLLDDGRELEADAVIFATGFESMEGWTSELISPQVARKVGRVWGFGSNTPRDPGPWEGELRNMWKPTQQEGLWFQGSLIAHARFYSHYLAVQLKARMEGIPTPVYGVPAAAPIG